MRCAVARASITRARAREYALTRTERTSRLAKRPYDLRHAGISFRFFSGVDPAECTRRAGQSIEVLCRHYAMFLDGVRQQANRLIEQSMNEWHRVGQGDAPEGRTEGLVRDWSGSTGQEGCSSGRKWELALKLASVGSGLSGKAPGV